MIDWQAALGEQKAQAYFQNLLAFVASERAAGKVIYPPAQDVFSAFKLCELAQVKVFILGQDPYHGPGQAHGLAFSVQDGIKIPPSLRNIFKELEQDIPNFKSPKSGNLSAWAKQGVLLLNTVLTVQEGQAHSHKNKGWEVFTDYVIKQVSDHLEGVVFLLWGRPAQSKSHLIDDSKHHILTSVHPSPLSAHRGFFGCRHFSQTNHLLTQAGKQAIDWCLD